MKDFDDFLRVLADEKSTEDIDLLILESAEEELQSENGLPIFLYDLIDAVTDYKLRKYHEWISQPED